MRGNDKRAFIIGFYQGQISHKIFRMMATHSKYLINVIYHYLPFIVYHIHWTVLYDSAVAGGS